MIPENEMGVIVIFAQQAERAGFEIVHIGSEFPDAIVRRDGKEYRTEFEFNAKSFITHRHDPRRCDLIICWKNDQSDLILSVLELSKPGWEQASITLPTESDRELAHWKYRALAAEAKLRKEATITRNVERAISCDTCERPFSTVQALNAHKRFCVDAGRPALDELALPVNGNTPTGAGGSV